MTNNELLRLLTSGHGRAAKHILERGADEFEGLLWKAINAPLPTYTEAPSAGYYADLVVHLSEPDRFVRRVIRALPHSNGHYRELVLERLMIELGLRGLPEARKYVFRSWRSGLASGDDLLARGYMRLRRAAAVPHIVGEAKRLAREVEKPVGVMSLWAQLVLLLGPARGEVVLRDAIADCPELVTRARWPEPSALARARMASTFEEFVAMVLSGEPVQMAPHFSLNDEQIGRLCQATVEAATDELRAHLLAPFKHYAWPGDWSLLIEWAKSKRGSVKTRAIAALARVHPHGVHALAYQSLNADPLDRLEAASYFNVAAASQDEPILMSLLADATTPAEHAEIEAELAGLVQSGRPGFALLRRYLYERSTSEASRAWAARGLILTRQATHQELEECLLDSYFATRDAAKRELRKRAKRKARASA